MTTQSTKILDTAIDTRNIAYSDGLKDNLAGANQRIDALQKRMDNSTRNMSDIAKQNDAMNADFKQIGGKLNANTDAINNNNNLLTHVINNGFYVTTKAVTTSVANEFREITGKAIDGFIVEAVNKKLRAYIKEAKQASVSASKMAAATQKASEQNIAILDSLAGFINIWLVEFAIIMAATLATPGLWKYLTLVATTSLAVLYNKEK